MSDSVDDGARGSADDGARRCLVLGYDRSDASRAAASWAASQLQPDGRLVIVHALRPLHAPPSPLVTHEQRVELGRAVVDELLLEGEDSMRDLELAAEVLDEDPVSALIDAASRYGADAIVVGSGRHSRLHKALGVVTDGLLSRSPVPVIAVPTPS
jgi:nucleotide-binding universal stress UspA family protein